MTDRKRAPARSNVPRGNNQRLDSVVADAIREREKRQQGYREQSLKIHPWVCARCGREFSRENLHELTVHHKDHNHDNNPADGSNWENLCLYCHDNEHQRYLEPASSPAGTTPGNQKKDGATHQPFAGLKNLMNGKEG